jgi:hypothetical protein
MRLMKFVKCSDVVRLVFSGFFLECLLQCNVILSLLVYFSSHAGGKNIAGLCQFYSNTEARHHKQYDNDTAAGKKSTRLRTCYVLIIVRFRAGGN